MDVTDEVQQHVSNEICQANCEYRIGPSTGGAWSLTRSACRSSSVYSEPLMNTTRYFYAGNIHIAKDQQASHGIASNCSPA